MLSDFRARVHAKRIAAQTRKLKRLTKAAEIWRKPALAVRRRPRKLKSAHQAAELRLDDLWAVYVKMRANRRTGGMCEVCLNRPVHSAYHILPRGHRAIRWALDNGVGSCAGCNNWERHNRGLRADDRHARAFGAGLLEDLKNRARGDGKHDLAQMAAIEADIKARIEARRWE